MTATDFFQSQLRSTWKSLPEDARPWGIWLAEYDAVPDDGDYSLADATVTRAWFMDQGEFQDRLPTDYARFVLDRDVYIS